MNKETDININNLGSDVPTSSEAGKRQQLVVSVRKLGELREYTESGVSAIGSLEAEQTLFENVPALALIADGNLKSAGNNNQTGLRIASLPAETVNQTQGQIDILLSVSLAIRTLSSARRLEPYLSVTLPKTQAGLKTLRLIAQRVVETMPLTEVNGLGNIPEMARVLNGLDRELKATALNNEEVINVLSVRAGEQAQARIDSETDSSGQVAQIRSMIAQQKLASLRREFVEVMGGVREYSRFEVLANQIIERDNLFDQVDSAKEATRKRVEKAKETVLAVIARKRAIGTVMTLIDQDPLLREVLARRSRLSPEGLLTADVGVKRQAANNALNSRKIILSVEERRVFYGNAVVDEERTKITQVLQNDPLSFVARLSDDELTVIRNGIPKISDDKSVFDLARDKLRGQLEDEVNDDEIEPVLTRIIIDEMLSARVKTAIDSAIVRQGIDRDSVLKDPSKLNRLKDVIMTSALEFLAVDLPEEEISVKATILTDSERKDQREAFAALFRRQKIPGRVLTLEAKALLDLQVERPAAVMLGPVMQREDIKSSLSPFQFFPEYKTTYPQVVVQALENLYAEFNQAFRRLVDANKEWGTDYQYCMAPDGTPVNGWVQIDMVGLPAGFLEGAASLSEEDVRETLRGRIFEIENSLAMYQLLGTIFSNGTQDTLFRRQLRASLDGLRQKYRKPIALLAVTDQKYQAMKEIEFGKMGGEVLSDEEVRELSGFDKFFGPEEFRQYVEENAGQCGYLLFVRSSDPVDKMKRPETVVENQLLVDDDLRRTIKANAITFNIDNPNWPIGDSRRINDTKEYLEEMGMAYAVFYGDDLFSADFETYLRLQGIDPEKVKSGEIALRAKPMKGTYGGYGHISGSLTDAKFKRELRRNLRSRGAYVVQPEMQNPTITNQYDGQTYKYIDRVYFSTDGQNYEFMGGGRTLIPASSIEAQNNRIHGNSSTVYAEID